MVLVLVVEVVAVGGFAVEDVCERGKELSLEKRADATFI
jgi:hypothetical protein